MTRFSPLNTCKTSRRRDIFAAALQPLEQRVLLSTVSIASAVANEGNPLQFTVSLDSASATPITVNYATGNKTAKTGINYSGGKGTITFNPGDTSETVSINTLDDNVASAPLAMKLKLSKPTKGVKISPNSAVGTINNVDAQPVFTVTGPAPIAAFTKGSKTVTFTINETGRSTAKVSVGYSTQDLTALGNTDYVPKSGTAKFSGKKTAFAVKVKIKPEADLVEDKDFLLQLSSPANATLGTPLYGVGVIGTLGTTSGSTISADAADSASAGSNAAITVTLSQPAADPVTVQYATSDGTATAGNGYTAATGTLTFPVGSVSQTIDVPTLNGAAGTFNVTLSNPTNAALAAGTTVVTISNTSQTVPIIAVNNPTIAEASSGSATANFTVTLSAPSTTDVTVNYQTVDGTAISSGGSANYTAASGTLTIPAGATTGLIPVTILGNVTTSASFTLELSSPSGATLSTNSSVATITNPNTSLPTLSIGDVTVDEAASGSTTANFTVTLSASSAQAVMVNYFTSDGTALGGTNYTAIPSTTLTIPAGSTSATIPVTILGNVASTGTFTVNLVSPATNAAISAASAVGTIVNANAALPTLSIGDVSQDEGTGANSTFVFPVTLSAPSATPVTVNYITGAAGDTATGISVGSTDPNGDYYSSNGTLTFPANTTTEDINITVIGDTTVEPNETFTVTLSSPTHATVSRAVAKGTIINDDTAAPTIPVISLNNVSVTQAEGGTTASFVVSLTGPAAQDITVDYSTSDGTAVAGTNYTAETNQVLTIPAGDTSGTINIPILYESDSTMVGMQKSFTLTLSSPSSNSTLSATNASATGTVSSVQYGPSAGFATNNQNVFFNEFNYSVTSSQSIPILDAQIQLFESAQGADLSNATPFQTFDVGSIGAGASVAGTISFNSNAPALTTGDVFTARLVINGVVYDENISPTIINNP